MKVRERWKVSIAVIMAAILLISLGDHFVSTIEAADNTGALVSTNIHHEDYYEGSGNWASNVKSYLYRRDTDNSLIRVETVNDTSGSATVIVETYDSKTFAMKSSITLLKELPLFGGFYAGRNYNYIVYGQQNIQANTGTNDDQEVFRIVQYSKDWTQRLKSAELSAKDINTRMPFAEGSLRFAESGNVIYVRTCHEIPAPEGSTFAQTNLTFSFNEGTGQISLGNVGYAGTSFNQFIQVDGDNLLTLDHASDSIVLSRHHISPNVSDSANSTVKIFSFGEVSATNSTRAAIGGFEVSNSKYLVAYQSGSQTNASGAEVRNVYLGKVSRTDFTQSSVENTQITSFPSDGRNSASNPVLVKLSEGSFILLWEEYDLTQSNKGMNALRYVKLNGEGVPQSAIRMVPGSLSDCQPVVSGNQLIWYVTDNSQPQFFTLDLGTNAITGSTPIPLASASVNPSASASVNPSVRPSVSPTVRPTATPVITPRPPRSPKPITTPRPTATPYPPYDEVVDDDSDLWNEDEVGEDNPSWEEINDSATEDHEKEDNDDDDDNDEDNDDDDNDDPDDVPKKGAHISNAKAEYVVTKSGSAYGAVEYFAPRTKAASVTIPETVTIDDIVYDVVSIASGAFKNDKSVTSITVGNNVSAIGKNAFNGCTKLKKVSIGSGVKNIGEKAFYHCEKLSKLTIPSAVNKIGKQAVAGCKKLGNITVKTTKLTAGKVGNKAFNGIPKNAVVKVPKAKLTAYKKIFQKKGLSAKVKVKKL